MFLAVLKGEASHRVSAPTLRVLQKKKWPGSRPAIQQNRNVRLKPP
jgi:hypothetical protein